jgi:hypothetical protein
MRNAKIEAKAFGENRGQTPISLPKTGCYHTKP